MEKLQKILSGCITDIYQIADLLGIDKAEAYELKRITDRYPVCSTKYYLDLINKDDPDDPIRKMCIPLIGEYSDEGSEDTSGENENTVMTGMQHKYRQTALILSTSRCAMYCRHCFRKRMVGYSSDEIADNIGKMGQYIREHDEINNVLISGGDAFLNSNKRIREYLETFSEIDSLDFIRFGTRVPVVVPERLTDDSELLEILKNFNRKKQLIVVTQYNHPNEITAESLKAVECLLNIGIPVRNQTVLLKGVNDDAETLSVLLNGLTRAGVLPYYIFQCRPARGVVNHFQVPIIKGLDIVEKAKSMLNGQSKGIRYIMSHPTGKIEILGHIGPETVFKYHQAKYPSDISRIFTRKLSNDICWLEDIPADK